MGLVYGELGIFHALNQHSIRHAIFFLGVRKYTTNTANEGEMAWTFPQQRIDLCITRLWCRMMNMSTDRLNSSVFKYAEYGKYVECKKLEEYN